MESFVLLLCIFIKHHFEIITRAYHDNGQNQFKKFRYLDYSSLKTIIYSSHPTGGTDRQQKLQLAILSQNCVCRCSGLNKHKNKSRYNIDTSMKKYFHHETPLCHFDCTNQTTILTRLKLHPCKYRHGLHQNHSAAKWLDARPAPVQQVH